LNGTPARNAAVGLSETRLVPAPKVTAAFALDEEMTVVRVSVFAAEYVASPASHAPVASPFASTASMR
jgi:hypothetical protein